MKKIQFVFSMLIAMCLCISLLPSPFNGANIVMAQSGNGVPQGWDLETTLPDDLVASIESGKMDLQKTLQIGSLHASRDGNLLKITGQGGADELRRVLYDGIGSGFSLISNRTDLSVNLPVVKDQVLTLKLETNITTGYGWEFAGSEGVTFTYDGAAQHQSRDDGLDGAPQVVTMDFKSNGDGIGKLNLSYKRPFGEPEQAVTRVNLRLAEYPGELDLSNPHPPSAALIVQESGPVNEPISDQPLDGLPSAWDWRTQGIVSPIRDQQRQTCGSGWAFATTGTMESAVKKGGGPLTDLSEQFLIDCNNNNYGCTYGQENSDILKYFVDTPGKNQTAVGAVLESDKPYTASEGNCLVAYDHPYKATSWQYLAGNWWTMPTVDQIKNAIYTYGPINAGVCIGDAFKVYTNGIFSTDESTTCMYTNQAIMLVGWDNATQTWILRNSWGADWGMGGYMNIKWGTSRVGLKSSWVVYTPPITIPTTILPSGTINATTPTYQWTSVPNATSYNIQVYKGSTKVMDKYYTNSVCSGSYCSTMPTAALPYAAYTWKVRAYIKNVWEGYSTARSFTIVPAGPNPVYPAGTIYITTPTYKWTAISGATYYHVQVYKGTTKVVDKYYNNSVCSGSYCSTTPTTALPYAAYTWKVRAKGSSWGAFSPVRSFTIASGFNSTFTSNTTGWVPVNGTWILVTSSPGLYKTYGAKNLFTSSAYSKTYSSLDYQVYMKRIGCSACSTYLEIRGTPTPLRSIDKAWYKSYRFQYTNRGYFSVYKINASKETALKPWTSSSYINSDSWNTLRVIASGSSLKFYINGHLLWSGSDSNFASGKVGIGMYKDSSTGNALYVDWAKLNTIVTPSAGNLVEPLAETGQEFPEWTDPFTSPN